MHRTLAKIVLISCFLMPAIARSQEMMGLQECLRLGLENNYELQITRNEALISDNNVTPGNAGFLPEVTLNSGYTFRNSNSDQFPAGEEETVQIRNANTGTTDAGVNLNWTLFEGFRVQTNYKQLKELQAVGELNARLAVENFIADLTAEYYNYVQQQIRLGNLQYAVALSRERLRIVESRYQVGSLSRLDLQQARVDFNADSSLLIQQYEILHTSRIRLNEMMGGDVNHLFAAQDTTIRFDATLSKQILLDAALQQNTILLLAGETGP